jgi:hypothetical protein
VACQVTIRSINGVVPIGTAQPTRVRATGTLVQCPGGALLTLTNTTSGASFTTATPAPPDADGRFLIDEPFPMGFAVACGDKVTALVFCAANPQCSDSISEPLACCQLRIIDVQGFVPPGALAPTGLVVYGSLFGFVNSAVDLTTTPPITSPVTGVIADQRTGLFSAVLPLLSPLPNGRTLLCGDTWFRLLAQTSGASPPAGCAASWPHGVTCPQCFRAQIEVTVGACSGNPPMADVTLRAQIALPANGTGQFEWHHLHDGTVTGPFAVTVGSGAPSATTTPPDEHHSYPPGTYTVELRRVDVSECPPVQVTFTVVCGCPQVTPSVVVGQCVTAAGATKDHRPVTYRFDFNPPLGTRTAQGTLHYGGADANGATTQQLSFTGPGPYASSPVYLAERAGGYSSNVSLLIQEAGGAIVCSPAQVDVSFSTTPGATPPVVNVDACLPCPTAVTAVEVVPPTMPLAAPHRQFRADVSWAPPAPPPPPPAPASYDWTLTLPGGAQATITNGPALVTTAADPTWHWMGPASDGHGAIDPAKLGAAGTHSVSVVAKFALSAGLPSDPATGVTSCNLSGGTGWNVPGPVKPPPPVVPPPPGKSAPSWCTFLLVLALILHVIGAIVLAVGMCLSNPYVIVVGVAILVVAWIVFAIWVALCAAMTPCSLLYTVFCILFWISAIIVPIILAVLIVITIFTSKWLCFLGIGLVEADWGLLFIWFTYAMISIAKCPWIDCLKRRAP